MRDYIYFISDIDSLLVDEVDEDDEDEFMKVSVVDSNIR
jgi:hypothetical protein